MGNIGLQYKKIGEFDKALEINQEVFGKLSGLLLKT
jgi:hypothetical protein